MSSQLMTEHQSINENFQKFSLIIFHLGRELLIFMAISNIIIYMTPKAPIYI